MPNDDKIVEELSERGGGGERIILLDVFKGRITLQEGCQSKNPPA